MDQLWEDAMLAATHRVRGAELANEAATLWQTLPMSTRDEFSELATLKYYERATDERLMAKLRGLLSRIFVPEFEYSIVRSLCIHLDYLQSTAPENLLSLGPVEVNSYLYEGDRGHLQLLHACAVNPTMTKYQALFVPEAMFDRYRLAFFLNSANQHGGQDWLIGAVEVTADHIVHDGPRAAVASALLLEAREVLQQRHQCYGCLARPLSCTPEGAWVVFRTLILHDDQGGYYLSAQELLVVAAYFGFSLSLYQYMPELSDEDCLQLLPSHILEGNTQHAHVVLNVDMEHGNARGHFSRLFNAYEWDTHGACFADDGMHFSDTSLSSSETGSETTDDEEEENTPILCQPCMPSMTQFDDESEPLEDDKDEDLESLSDVSENSDLFHVSARETPEPRTAEDRDLETIRSIAQHLRKYPLLPPRAADAGQSFTDVDTAERLPLLHCGSIKLSRFPLEVSEVGAGWREGGESSLDKVDLIFFQTGML
jgi:hypothetical protein